MSVEGADYWVVSDRVCFPEGERAAGLLVAGCRLAEVRPAHEVRSAARQPRGQEPVVFDVGSDPVVPGWVNAHTHLAMAPLRGITSKLARTGNVVTDVFFNIESKMTAADVLAFSRMGAFESALCGGLFVFDHYYFGRAIAQALCEVGISGVVGPTVADLAGPFVHEVEVQLESTLEIALDKSLWERGISAALAPHAGDTVSSDLMSRVGELARRHRLPVHLHLAQSMEEAASLSGGEPSIDAGVKRIAEQLDSCSVLVAHGLHLSDQLVAMLTGRKWVLAYCPLSQLQFGFLGPLSAWLSHGGRVAIGTDCVASNDALDVQRELPIVAGQAGLVASFSEERRNLIANGLLRHSFAAEKRRKDELSGPVLIEPEGLLQAANGGAFSSWGESAFGSSVSCAPLEVGALANFLVLESSHPALFGAGDLGRALAYGSTQNAIKWGVAAGRRKGQDRGWREEWLDTPEYREAFDEAVARRDELLVRAGIL